MALQSVTPLNIDFCKKKYILINAKQLDRSSRVLLATCYNNGEPFYLNNQEHSAYIRYKKSDGYSVFNFCEINNDGKVLIELTEQMLASSGISNADLVIANKGGAKVDSNTGEIVAVNNSSILSTMNFCIDVSEIPTDGSDIESSYEINIINETLSRYEANYENVVQTAKSWAVGGTGIRSDEAENNAKYWSEVAAKNAVGVPSVVTSIKGDKETTYRSGQINITANNVGAIPTEDIATNNEVKNYLGIV